MDQNSSSPLKRNTTLQKAQVLRESHVILIDEITMLNRHGLRIIDEVLRAIMGQPQVPFGGKVIVVGGDFRQLLPVVVDHQDQKFWLKPEDVTSSPLWDNFQVISLTDNMRAQGDANFIEWLLRVGTGCLPDIPEIQAANMIEIPQDMLLQIPPQPRRRQPIQNPDAMPEELQLMIDQVFGNNIANLTPIELSSRAILASIIKVVSKVNDFIINSLPGNVTQYLSFDSVVSDDQNDVQNFPPEFLNQQQSSGLPPHNLKLKIGAVIMLLRNLSPEDGLSNGTKLKVKELHQNAILAEILSECHRGDEVFIVKIELESGTSNLPIKLKRLQFPIIPAYAMTINKSQGQTLDKVGIYLHEIVFSHGQLYVAFSRCRNKDSIKVFVKDQDNKQGHLLRHLPGQEHRVFTRNVIYREVFRHRKIYAHLPHLADEDPELHRLILQDMEDDEAGGINMADIDPILQNCS